MDNLAKKVDKCPLYRVVEYCLCTIVIVIVILTPTRGAREDVQYMHRTILEERERSRVSSNINSRSRPLGNECIHFTVGSI